MFYINIIDYIFTCIFQNGINDRVRLAVRYSILEYASIVIFLCSVNHLGYSYKHEVKPIENVMKSFLQKFAISLFGTAIIGLATAQAADLKLLNVSYDPTRELYQDYNAVFAKHWKEQTGQDIEIQQSHGGSGRSQDRFRRQP